MKKTLAILTLMVVVMAGSVFATDAGKASIGTASIFRADNTDMYFLPSTIVNYSRLIRAELGINPLDTSAAPSNKATVAVTFANAEKSYGVVGLDINTPVSNEAKFAENLTYVLSNYGAPVIPVFNKFHVFYARGVGDMTAGLHIGYAGSSATSKYNDSVPGSGVTSNLSASVWEFNPSLSLKSGDAITADLGVSFRLYSFEAKQDLATTPPYSEKIASDGGTGLDIFGRAFYGMSNEVKIVPMVIFSTNSFGYKASSSDTSFHPQSGKQSSMLIAAAFGTQYTPVENVTILGGLHMAYDKETTKDSNGVWGYGPGYKEHSTSTFMLPAFSIGVDAQVLKWLCVRLGGSKQLAKTTYKDEYHTVLNGNIKTESSSTSASYGYNMGLGLTFGKLGIDMKLNKDQLFNGGYLLSGVQQTPFTQVSATYTF